MVYATNMLLFKLKHNWDIITNVESTGHYGVGENITALYPIKWKLVWKPPWQNDLIKKGLYKKDIKAISGCFSTKKWDL